MENAVITHGEILYLDKKLNGLPPHKISAQGIILVPEENKVYQTLTTEENLAAVQGSGKWANDARDWIYEKFPILQRFRSRLAGVLSGGERQMLGFAQALLCRPKVLLVDEFSLGLSPIAIEKLTEDLVQMREDFGLTLILVEQNVSIALEISDRGIVMENGRVVFAGTSETLLEKEDVREFYLGISGEKDVSYRDVKQYRRTRRWWG